MNNFSDKVSFIWSVADLLRGPYKPNQYGKVILPLTVLRRLDCVLEPTRQKVRDKAEELKRKGTPISNLEPVLNRAAMPTDWPKDRPFPLHNTSKFDFRALAGDPDSIAKNLTHYIKSFSSKAREIIEYFGFAEQIEKLDKANRLYLVVSKFAEIDLHPSTVSNVEMGYIFEELIRKFSEAANEGVVALTAWQSPAQQGLMGQIARHNDFIRKALHERLHTLKAPSRSSTQCQAPDRSRPPS